MTQPRDVHVVYLEQRVKELETALLALQGSKHSLLRVMEFHQAFGHPIAEIPTVPTFELRKLRVNLIFEEAGEFLTASGLMTTPAYRLYSTLHRYLLDMEEWQTAEAPPAHLIDAADALADLDYVVQGANLVWGLPAEAIAREVHRSNMSKLGEDGKPVLRGDGKILKGPNYEPPRIQAILFPEIESGKLEDSYGVIADRPEGELFPKNPQSAPHPSE